MRAARVLVASLLAALAAPAASYVRSTSETTGVPLFWPVPVVPYHVSSHPHSPSPACAPAGGRDPALDEVNAGFAAWRQECSALELPYAGRIDEIRVGLGGSDENLVAFRQGFCSDHPQAATHECRTSELDCGDLFNCFEDQGAEDRKIVALTSVLYDPRSGRIFDADIELNGWDGAGAGDALEPSGAPGRPAPRGWYFTCEKRPEWTAADECTRYGEAGCYYLDLRNTVTHEVGHLIGLAHAPDPATTMFASTGPGEVSKQTLSGDDVAGVCEVYPHRDDGGGGCASSGAAPGLAALLLVAAARWSRRRGR